MADERKLFDKPMNELREAFVRARFAQDDVFGMHDVETWLPLQRNATRPDGQWENVLGREFMSMCAATAPLTHLRECATQHSTQGPEGDNPYRRIFIQLRGRYYQGDRRVGVYAPVGLNELFAFNSECGRLTIEYIRDTNADVGARAVVDVLFAEWDRQRPKWKKAREFLCDAFAAEVKREHAKAEHDFDTAVAVSADGTKICHADFVLVLGKHGESNSVWFPGSAFRANKTLRVSDKCSPTCEICPAWRTYCSLKTFRFSVFHPGQIFYAYYNGIEHARRGHTQMLFRCEDNKNVLCIYHDQCPSPLPDGGVEVTV